ncbi:MAG: hypothetical protein CBB71_09095 [Rhodopirellula sp. TMED11]|nr:MAG: hypothetical protein CBB71_09095 [Rhodopirellula sp. TMED11]
MHQSKRGNASDALAKPTAKKSAPDTEDHCQDSPKHWGFLLAIGGGCDTDHTGGDDENSHDESLVAGQ